MSPWWAVATFVVTTFVAGGAARLVDPAADPDWPSLLALAPAIGAGVTWLIGRRWLATMLPGPVPRAQMIAHTILGVVAALLLTGLVAAGVALWPDAGGTVPQGVEVPLLAVLVLLPWALLQEIGWRGTLQPLLEARLGRMLACVGTGLVWAAWRLELSEPATLLGTLVLSVALSVLLGHLAGGSWWQRVLTATVAQWLVSSGLVLLVGVDPSVAGTVVAAAAATVTAVVFLLLFRQAQRRRAARRAEA